MNDCARSAAALPVWGLVGAAALVGTTVSAIVHASRSGCIGPRVADFVSVGGIAGLALGISALLVVGAVPAYRRAPLACGAAIALALSVYAIVAFLSRNTGSCAF